MARSLDFCPGGALEETAHVTIKRMLLKASWRKSPLSQVLEEVPAAKAESTAWVGLGARSKGCVQGQSPGLIRLDVLKAPDQMLFVCLF